MCDHLLTMKNIITILIVLTTVKSESLLQDFKQRNGDIESTKEHVRENNIFSFQSQIQQVAKKWMNIQLNNKILQNYETNLISSPDRIGAKAGSLLNQDLYLPDIKGNISEACRRDVQTIMTGAASKYSTSTKMKEVVPWVWRLIDSWGKTADGWMWGNQLITGFIDECLAIEPTKDDQILFQGKYCLITYSYVGEDYDYMRDMARTINMPSQSINMKESSVAVRYSTCMPSSCTTEELSESISEILEKNNHELKYISCQTKDNRTYDASEIFGITFFSIIGLLLLVATATDLYIVSTKKDHLRKTGVKFLLAFSVWSNLPKIYNIQEKPSKSVITCVHGIRSLSLFWVVWGHQISVTFNNCQNTLSVVKLTSPFIVQTIMNADKSVDSFFMMGGLFLTIGVLSNTNKTKRFNIPLYYIHRILRVLPALSLMVCFTATITTLLAQGPYKEVYTDFIKNGCRKAWFSDMMFLSNYLMEEGLTSYLDGFNGASCIGQSWYLSADMQIYIIMPLILLPIYYNRKIGLALLGVWTVAALAIPGAIIGANNLWGGGLMTTKQKDLYEYQRLVYLTPWCRIQANLVGVWAGFIIFWNRDNTFKLTKLQILIGWIISLTCITSVLYGVYPYNQFGPEVPPISLTETVVYNIFQRAVWSLGLAWIIIACHWGYGGFINEILSHPCWQPISRLSYAMFLIALPMQLVIIFNEVRPVYVTHFTMFQSAVGTLTWCIILATILSLAAESPIIAIEKYLLHSGGEEVGKQEQPKTKSVDFGQTHDAEIIEKQLPDDEGITKM